MLFGSKKRGPFGGEIKPYSPTIAERAQGGLMGALSALGVDPRTANRYSSRAVNALTDLTPLGMADEAQQAYRAVRGALSRGDYGAAAGGLFGGALAVAPIPGPAKKGLSGARRSLGGSGPEPSPGAFQPARRTANTAAMGDSPVARAERLRQGLVARGVKAGPVKSSTNRYGEESAYIDSPFGELRISDHDANMDFRPGQVQVFTDDADKLIADVEASRQRRAAQQAAERAQIEAKERPFRERFLSAPEHQQTQIIVEAYPWMANDKAARQQLRRKWLGR